MEQKTHAVEKGCANKDADLKTKQDANGHNSQKNAIKTINYFFSSSNVDADKRKSKELTQEIHNTFGDVYNGIGCFKDTFSLQLKPDRLAYT